MPICGTKGALDVISRLRKDSRKWLTKSGVLFCFEFNDMKIAYNTSRVFAVLFGLSVTLSFLNNEFEMEFWAAFFSTAAFVLLSIYFGKKIRKTQKSANREELKQNVSVVLDKNKKLKKFGYIYWAILIIFCSYIAVVFFLDREEFQMEGKEDESITAQSQNVEELKERLNEILELENNYEFEKIYDSYLSPESKARLTKETYLENMKEYFEDKERYSEIFINDARINGNIGYVDRIRVDCSDAECLSKEETRSYKKFVYVDNEWRLVVEEEPIYCVRETEYTMPEEFKRSLSLIGQRFKEEGTERDESWESFVSNVKNCLNIQYAKPDDAFFDVESVEGLFMFTPTQSMEKFDIFVSPKYQVKDDLLTSILLVHEIVHVRNFISSQRQGKQLDCFENEASAFSTQNYFASILNQEEINSINARVARNISKEAQQVVDVFTVVPKFPGDNYYEKSLNFVKANPAYQKLCKEQAESSK